MSESSLIEAESVPSGWLTVGAVHGALTVILGAFGAHALKERLTPDRLELWDTAVLYLALHALALVAYGLFRTLLVRRSGGAAGWCFFFGTVIFSGTVHALALGAPRWLGAVTPIGGVLLIVGWVLFAVETRRNYSLQRS